MGEVIAALLIIQVVLSLIKIAQVRLQNRKLDEIKDSQVPVITLAETFINMAIEEIGRIKQDVEGIKSSKQNASIDHVNRSDNN